MDRYWYGWPGGAPSGGACACGGNWQDQAMRAAMACLPPQAAFPMPVMMGPAPCAPAWWPGAAAPPTQMPTQMLMMNTSQPPSAAMMHAVSLPSHGDSGKGAYASQTAALPPASSTPSQAGAPYAAPSYPYAPPGYYPAGQCGVPMPMCPPPMQTGAGCGGPTRWVQVGNYAGPLAAGETKTVEISLRAPFKGERMIIPSSQAPKLRVISVNAGVRPVLIDSGEIAGEAYSSDQETSGRLSLPWLNTNDTIRVTVRNVSADDLERADVTFEGETYSP